MIAPLQPEDVDAEFDRIVAEATASCDWAFDLARAGLGFGWSVTDPPRVVIDGFRPDEHGYPVLHAHIEGTIEHVTTTVRVTLSKDEDE